MTRGASIFLGGIFALAFLAVPRAAQAAPPIPNQVGFSNVSVSSLVVHWQAAQGATIQFTVELSSNAFAGSLSSTTFMLSSTFTALDVNTEFFARVISIDTVDSSSSAWTATVSTFTLANPPLSLSTTPVSATQVDLSWNENGNPAGTLYSIERSTDGILYIVLATQAGSTYSDATVSAGVTYAYRLRALNGNNVPSAYSNVVLAGTTGSSFSNAPARPTGIWMERADIGGGILQVTLRWHAVTERADGTALTNLSGYELYSADSLLTPKAQWVLETTVGTEVASATAPASATKYFALRTVDTDGLQSEWSQTIDDSSDMNHFFFAADNTSRVQLPQSAADILRSEENSFGADLIFELDEQSAEETGRVVRSIRITITNTVTGNPVTTLSFDPPVLRGVLAYSVSNGNVVTGAPRHSNVSAWSERWRIGESLRMPSLFGGAPVISAADADQELSLYWFNGNEWVKTTGIVNTSDNTVSFTGAHAGAFQIRAASHVTGVALTNVYPRIISPNGDGWNDKALFFFDNPELLPVTGKIYDITGALVAELEDGPYPDSSLSWNGKDTKGTTVPGGIYMYQIDVDPAPQTGTIVVAR